MQGPTPHPQPLFPKGRGETNSAKLPKVTTVPRLIVIKGADEGKQFELAGNVFGIGRDATNALRLHDTEVSRRHAEFRPVDGGYRIVDLNSANGTFINNQPVKDAVLRSGDHVQIGQTTLVYSAGRGGAHARRATDRRFPG